MYVYQVSATIEKAKLPKGMSYVFSSSTLVDAVNIANADLNVHIRYYIGKPSFLSSRIFECEYWLPNQNVNHCRLYIKLKAVTISDKSKVQQGLDSQVIPQFIEWVKFMNGLSENSTLLKHGSCFRVSIVDNILDIESDPKATQAQSDHR